MQLCSIASGSSGNCIFVGSSNTRLLVDCGISGKRIEEGLKGFGVETGQLDGVLITHEHNDHISGLGVMIRRYHLPVYATERTIEALKGTKALGDLSGAEFVAVRQEVRFRIGDVDVLPVPVWHDAVDPVAYRFDCEDRAVGILTDSGRFDEEIVASMKGLHALLLEANHDENMLLAGRYPYYLKRRILSDRGHLSNETSGRLLNELLWDDMEYVILGHLSKENNYPDLAYETVRMEVDLAENKYCSGDFKLSVAKRDCVSEMICI